MRPYYDDGTVAIHHGDSRELLPELRADVIVADPPYGLAFMGRKWDQVDQQFHQAWASAALRALPPGGWLLAFGGTRTWHRLACGIEDAGFEVRDTLMWLYGTGYPAGKARLKPAWEPVLLARKPGSSVLQIIRMRETCTTGRSGGRWPANVVLDPEVATLLDQQTGDLPSQRTRTDPARNSPDTASHLGSLHGSGGRREYLGQSGGASRFFYTAKAGRNERVTVDGEQHPTVKPLALMRWLVRLVTPPGGTVLDPFCGSGSTLVAAAMEGFRAIGVEADERWCRGSAQRLSEIPPVQESLAL